MAENDIHSRRSSYREMLLEHLLAGEVMRHLWVAGFGSMEILKPQVDDMSAYRIWAATKRPAIRKAMQPA